MFSHFDSSRGKESGQEQADKLLKRWLGGPVVLVSSSETRKKALQAIGFNASKISLLSAPDSDEKQALENYVDNFTDNHFYPHRTLAPVHIAVKKLEYAVDKVPAEAMVIAADTVLHRFVDGAPNSYLAEVVHKPKNKVEAAAAMRQMFDGLAVGYVRFKSAAEGLRLAAPHKKNIEDIINRLKIGWRSIQLQTTTGVAVRLPNQDRFGTIESTITILPEKIYQIVDQVQQKNEAGDDVIVSGEYVAAMNGLIKKVIELAGDNVTRVSAGIPWQNEEIRKCLDVRLARDINFLPHDRVSPELFSGLPSDAVLDYLRRQAAELAG